MQLDTIISSGPANVCHNPTHLAAVLLGLGITDE